MTCPLVCWRNYIALDGYSCRRISLNANAWTISSTRQQKSEYWLISCWLTDRSHDYSGRLCPHTIDIHPSPSPMFLYGSVRLRHSHYRSTDIRFNSARFLESVFVTLLNPFVKLHGKMVQVIIGSNAFINIKNNKFLNCLFGATPSPHIMPRIFLTTRWVNNSS